MSLILEIIELLDRAIAVFYKYASVVLIASALGFAINLQWDMSLYALVIGLSCAIGYKIGKKLDEIL
jgi:hypothetical protein